MFLLDNIYLQKDINNDQQLVQNHHSEKLEEFGRVIFFPTQVI